MKTNLKQFNKSTKRIFLGLNIILVSTIIVMFIVYTILRGINGLDEVKWLGVTTMALFGIFGFLNVVVISIELANRNRIERTIVNFINQKQYEEGIEYISRIGRKRNTYSTNQRILYYLGYLELLLDRVDNAIYYLQQFDTNKQYSMNIDCHTTVIYLMYLVYFIKGDVAHLKEINSIYESKKDSILKARKSKKNNRGIMNLFDTIDLLKNSNIELAVAKLEKSRSFDVPLIKRYVTENHSIAHL